MQIKFLFTLVLLRRSHEFLFIYVFGERSDTALPTFVTTIYNAYLIMYVLETLVISYLKFLIPVCCNRDLRIGSRPTSAQNLVL